MCCGVCTPGTAPPPPTTIVGIPQTQRDGEASGAVTTATSKDGEEKKDDGSNQDLLMEKVEKIVLDCLETCAEEGFEKAAVEAAINSIEFQLREFNTGSFPKGLAVILQIVSDWNSDRVCTPVFVLFLSVLHGFRPSDTSFFFVSSSVFLVESLGCTWCVCLIASCLQSTFRRLQSSSRI